MRPIDKFHPGNINIPRLNELVERINILSNLKTQGSLQSCVNAGGVMVWDSKAKTLGMIIRSAFCKANAGASNIITCFLDTDTSGTEINVTCEICGGTALNAAFPRLEDGDRIFVMHDGIKWRALQIFQATEDC